MIDDVRDFKVCDDAMNHLGMTAEERFSVYTIVASVLHLGNIGFEDNQEDTKGMVAGNQGNLACTISLGLNKLIFYPLMIEVS